MLTMEEAEAKVRLFLTALYDEGWELSDANVYLCKVGEG